MNVYVIISAALVVYFALVWLLGTVLGLKGADLWILRGGLALIGLLAAGAYLWYRWKGAATRASSRAGQPAGSAEPSGDIDPLLREAEARLSASELGGKATVSRLPLILFLGKEGSAKTSSIACF